MVSHLPWKLLPSGPALGNRWNWDAIEDRAMDWLISSRATVDKRVSMAVAEHPEPDLERMASAERVCMYKLDS